MKNLSNKEANKVTRECLQTALIQLMSQKPFEKITITELVRPVRRVPDCLLPQLRIQGGDLK